METNKNGYFTYSLETESLVYTFLITSCENAGPRICCVFSLGIITGLSIFGPAVAYGLGGVFSQIYVTLEGKYNTLIIFLTFSSHRITIFFANFLANRICN